MLRRFADNMPARQYRRSNYSHARIFIESGLIVGGCGGRIGEVLPRPHRRAWTFTQAGTAACAMTLHGYGPPGPEDAIDHAGSSQSRPFAVGKAGKPTFYTSSGAGLSCQWVDCELPHPRGQGPHITRLSNMPHSHVELLLFTVAEPWYDCYGMRQP